MNNIILINYDIYENLLTKMHHYYIIMTVKVKTYM